MNIPVDSQAQVLVPIIRYGLAKAPVGLGVILGELTLGRRCKTNAVEQAVRETMKGNKDKHGTLQDLLYMIYPRGPSSPWGWSRTGWGWQQWWALAENLLSLL